MHSETGMAYRFGEILKRIDAIYERYARSVGMNYTGLYVFHTIAEARECTQKQLCEQLYLPKQTVNSIVKSFQRAGLAEMSERAEDRRSKRIYLTESGRAYAKRILPAISDAQTRGIGRFTQEERALLLDLMERYAEAFCSELIPNKRS